MFKPQFLLHIEGAVVMLASGVAYHQLHGRWLWFALLFLVPDLFMLGYGVNLKIGAAFYNLAHNYALPLLVFCILWLAGYHACLWPELIWLAHIGMDRMLGYGLKYDTAFKDTHLQRI